LYTLFPQIFPSKGWALHSSHYQKIKDKNLGRPTEWNHYFLKSTKALEKSDFSAYVFFAGPNKAKSNEALKVLKRRKFTISEGHLLEYLIENKWI
jgi:hypothetical protein